MPFAKDPNAPRLTLQPNLQPTTTLPPLQEPTIWEHSTVGHFSLQVCGFNYRIGRVGNNIKRAWKNSEKEAMI
jgi:hypothetical protein